jgi:hypothetical protein
MADSASLRGGLTEDWLVVEHARRTLTLVFYARRPSIGGHLRRRVLSKTMSARRSGSLR